MHECQSQGPYCYGELFKNWIFSNLVVDVEDSSNLTFSHHVDFLTSSFGDILRIDMLRL